ncbi:unnamed protein product [Trifolium pratense]|uniref:Uncharacterized protein n=1 Tax=Trifolium pratense TaxID=57577 RepID=A0ACB0JAY9_TRIPR|nr:unnamed protein product [Trifolium pratense]
MEHAWEERAHQGSGMKISMRQLGVDMIQQMQHPCNEFKGNGEMIKLQGTMPTMQGKESCSTEESTSDSREIEF